jgi:hypothetical protein
MSYCFSFLFFCVVTIRNTGIKFACSNVVERKDNTLKNQLLVTSRSQSVRPSSSALQNYSFDSTTPEYGLDLPVYYKRMQGVVASVNGFFFNLHNGVSPSKGFFFSDIVSLSVPY